MMHFAPETIYHIYNQGNNRQPIFFQRRNYYFFLDKMRAYLLPHVDLLCYCLMPNHFHFLVQTKPTLEGKALNSSLGILLRTYTRAINRQEERSGSLFRQHTKAKAGAIDTIVDYPILPAQSDLFYARQCFHYIHQNPVKAGLVRQPGDWPFSSAADYANWRRSSLCNRPLTRQLELF